MTAIPPKLAERIADLDRLIEGNEADIADYEVRIKAAWLNLEKYRLARQEIQEAVALCREAWQPPPPWEIAAPSAPLEFVINPPAPPAPRQRRDLREVVRQILLGRQLVLGVGNEGIHATEIAELASRPGRAVRTSEILRALARMDGEVTHDGAVSPEACLWCLAVDPTDTIPREHQTDVPQCWCGYSHRSENPTSDAECSTMAEVFPSLDRGHDPAPADPPEIMHGAADGTRLTVGPAPSPPTDDQILAHFMEAGERGLDRADAMAFCAGNHAGLNYLVMTNRIEITKRGYRAIEAA